MNERIDLDRLLSAWLTADAPIREPEPLLERVLARTARTRRRAAWQIPERWFPVSTITTRVEGAARFPWRTVGVVALLMLVLAVGALVIAGSRAKALPPPFGPAHNGQLLYSVDGDIVAVDGPGAAPRTLIGGPTTDSLPLFSRDGTHFAFQRATNDAGVDLWYAATDGTDVQRLSGPFSAVDWYDWSPSGDALTVATPDDPTSLLIVATNSPGFRREEIGVTVEVPVFRPGDGSQIAFRGKAADGTWGIYLIGRDGTNMQRLDLDPGFATDPAYEVDRDHYFFEPTWSPDGGRLMYYTLEPDPTSPAGAGFRTHIADISASGVVTADRKLEFDREADDEFVPRWLPSGDAIVFQSLDGSVHRVFSAGIAAGAPARDLGLIYNGYIASQVSPDGRQLLLSLPMVASEQREISVMDLATLTATPFDAANDDFAWQRAAD